LGERESPEVARGGPSNCKASNVGTPRTEEGKLLPSWEEKRFGKGGHLLGGRKYDTIGGVLPGLGEKNPRGKKKKMKMETPENRRKEIVIGGSNP